MKASCFETSVHICPATQRLDPETFYPQRHHSNYVERRTAVIVRITLVLILIPSPPARPPTFCNYFYLHLLILQQIGLKQILLTVYFICEYFH